MNLNKLLYCVALWIVLNVSGCANNQSQDFSYLNIKTKLTEDDVKYYRDIRSEVNEIAKDFAYEKVFPHKSSILKQHCRMLFGIAYELTQKPISTEREDELARINNLAAAGCPHCFSGDRASDVENTIYCSPRQKYTIEELEYLIKKLPNSYSLRFQLSSYYSRRKTAFYQKKAIEFDQQAFKLLKGDSPKRQHKQFYCRKSVKNKEWDYIYFLTKDLTIVQVETCLRKGANYSGDLCCEAVSMVANHWPTEYWNYIELGSL